MVDTVLPAQSALVQDSVVHYAPGGHHSSDSLNSSSALANSERSFANTPISGNASASSAGVSQEPAARDNPLQIHDHPLSPEASPEPTSKASYFQTSVLPGISPVSQLIFGDDEDETPEPSMDSRQGDLQIGTQQHISASPGSCQQRNDAPASDGTFTLRLPQAPHFLTAAAVDERLREVTSSNLRGILLAQELSRQLQSSQRELEQLRKTQRNREKALINLLKEAGGVSESLVSRTLVRADADDLESGPPTSGGHVWKVTVGSDVPSGHSKNKGSRERLPLTDVLQDAMSENDFRDSARSASPLIPIAVAKGSPKVRQTPTSPAQIVGSNLHERRGRQSSQSLSARLFGGFTPPTVSYLSPTHEGFQPPLAASSGEGSPAQLPGKSIKKSRANSIRSVASTSSHQSSRATVGWAGSIWSWNKGDNKTRYFSDDDEEDDEDAAAADDATPVASNSAAQTGTLNSGKGPGSSAKQLQGRSRTFSKSSSNSASTKSNETTAATSFSSHAILSPGDDPLLANLPEAPELKKSATFTSTVTLEDREKGERHSPKRSEGPIRALMGRRSSGLHPDSALTTDVVPVPVSAAVTSPPRASSSKRGEALPTSTSILQSLHARACEQEAIHSPALDPPLHFRAVSESASTIGKSAGREMKQEIFMAPDTVSPQISDWTVRLLRSMSGQASNASLTAVQTADSPASVGMDRSGSGSLSPSTNRSKSPRISQATSKASLSPATLIADGSSKAVRLSVSESVEHTYTTQPSSEPAPDAMPLAQNEAKQKGYIASAKGTIGRALGFGSTGSNSPAAGSPTGPKTSSTTRKPRSNSLRAVVEPALTVPDAFTSFSAPMTALTATVPPNNRPKHRLPSNTSASPLEMGTIVAPEAKPPTLSNDLADQMKDGPLVDRFGFVYDVKAGMKLLREYRRKQDDLDEKVITLDPPLVVDVEDLREAIGPSPLATPGLETTITGAALGLNKEATPPSLQVTQAEDTGTGHIETAPAMLPTNQSIRRLLSQLGEMNESVEQSQKEAWDAFIKRRRKKMHKQPRDDEPAAAAKARKKRLMKVETPLSIAGNSLDDELVDTQFSDNLVGVASMGADKQDDKIFRHLVRSGIPIAYRSSVWAEVSGASEIREPGLYQELLNSHAGEPSPCIEQIDMDTHRTFPTNVFFAGSGPGVAKLRRVLIAYSWRDPAIGYCQGMNLLAALLLLVYPDEEDAFWMLASVLERTLPSDYYSSQLLVSQADQRVLQDLIQLALPDLYNHLEDLGVDLPAITFGWFLSLFTDALPIQTLLRVWDVLLVYGPISLFKISIAIFKIHSAEIFATDSASTFYVLLTNLTSHLYSADKLLKTAFDDLKFIKRHDVEWRRLKHVADIEQELAPRQLSPAPMTPPEAASITSAPKQGTPDIGSTVHAA